jgi:hypothetical protein
MCWQFVRDPGRPAPNHDFAPNQTGQGACMVAIWSIFVSPPAMCALPLGSTSIQTYWEREKAELRSENAWFIFIIRKMKMNKATYITIFMY